MEVCRRSSWLLLLLGVSLLATTLQGVQGEAESEGPSESECRPYIEKALKELETGESGTLGTPDTGDSKEDVPTVEVTTDDSDHQEGEGENDTHEEGTESIEVDQSVPDEQQSDQEDTQEESAEGTATENAEETDTAESVEQEAADQPAPEEEDTTEKAETEEDTAEATEPEAVETEEQAVEAEPEQSVEAEGEATAEESAEGGATTEESAEGGATAEESAEGGATTEESAEGEATPEEGAATEESAEGEATTEEGSEEPAPEEGDTQEETGDTKEETDDTTEQTETQEEGDTAEDTESLEAEAQVLEPSEDTQEETEEVKEEGGESEQKESVEGEVDSVEEPQAESIEAPASQEETKEGKTQEDETDTKEQDETAEEKEEPQQDEPGEDTKSDSTEDDKSGIKEEETAEAPESVETAEDQGSSAETETAGVVDERSAEKDDSTADEAQTEEVKEGEAAEASTGESAEGEEPAAVAEESTEEAEAPSAEESVEGETKSAEEGESAPVEELSLDVEIPDNLRDRNHVEHLLKIDEEASEAEKIINRVAEITLKELKKLYENAIKPLEVLYKYRDLSNRHFGDSEIFSKPLILFMGPWSGGKSSIINYLLDNEYNETSLRTGAEPSPAYFNILMYGDEYEVLDGTQLAADFTFSGLQKFGQGLEERLRGVRLPSKLLEKVNIVEIPGILEVRKLVSRVFPFNDACQWFIDRADIIFLVYDPSKLDVGPETEAILDQLKGREHQTRIILNKADQVKPEELMRVQGALIWNISPLMSSAQPPVMYTTSLWSRPYESWAPSRLLQAQERAFLRDLRTAIDKRIENKIASARRFAVRVRNHAKMVDCYLTTYYNHKSVFGNRKQVADTIIEHPQDYHIYEGLSTLTNISRYDLPDPDVYKDFFKLNALYDFQQLSATCTYFRGCPINRLDVAIAYDLPELVGKHKRLVENALTQANQAPVPGS